MKTINFVTLYKKTKICSDNDLKCKVENITKRKENKERKAKCNFHIFISKFEVEVFTILGFWRWRGISRGSSSTVSIGNGTKEVDVKCTGSAAGQ